jgi:hypothetical protein
MCQTARGYQLKQICCSFMKHHRFQCSNTRFSKSQDINACSKEACSPAVVTMVKRGQLWAVLLHRTRSPSNVGWEGVIVDVERSKLWNLFCSKTAFCFKADYWAHAVGKVTMLQDGRPDSGSGASRLLDRRCEVDCCIQTEVKNEWSYTPTPPMYLSGLTGTVLLYVSEAPTTDVESRTT